jgi:predicted GIY-YIG superfamily endonuclease
MNPYKIYKITFPNDKVYIGQTRRSVKQRLNEHHKGRRKSVLQKALVKYGIENIKVNVIKSNLSLDEANELEVKLIKPFQDKDWRSKISSSQKGILDGVIKIKKEIQ